MASSVRDIKAALQSVVDSGRDIDLTPDEARHILSAMQGPVDALKAILGIDNPPAGEPGHVDFRQALELGRSAVAEFECGK